MLWSRITRNMLCCCIVGAGIAAIGSNARTNNAATQYKTLVGFGLLDASKSTGMI